MCTGLGTATGATPAAGAGCVYHAPIEPGSRNRDCRDLLFADGHPTPAGHAAVAEIIAQPWNAVPL